MNRDDFFSSNGKILVERIDNNIENYKKYNIQYDNICERTDKTAKKKIFLSDRELKFKKALKLKNDFKEKMLLLSLNG